MESWRATSVRALKGKVVSGRGEGASYVELYRENFIRYLGLDPFPGTLNLEVEDRASLERALSMAKPIVVPPPRPGLGTVLAYKAFLKQLRVFVVRPEKTSHPPNVVELLSERYLRRFLGLRDGDVVTVYVLGEA